MREPFSAHELPELVRWVTVARDPFRSSVSHAHRVIGFTNGCFEIIHAGHIQALQESASLCDVLIVGINSDASMTRIKRAPIICEQDRAAVVNAIKRVAAVVLFEEDNPVELIKAIRPNIYFKGEDYRGKSPGETVRAALAIGAALHYTKLVDGRSTTSIHSKRNKDVQSIVPST